MSLPSARRGPIRLSFDRLETRRLLTHGPAHHGQPDASVHHADVFTNLVYSQDQDGPLRLDVLLPQGREPAGGWPVVLAIHGGGWRKYDKEQYEAKVARALTSGGFAVVAPDYTLSAPGRATWPENLDELRQAVQWVKENAAEFHLDPTRVAAMGESAGGHLAAMLGSDPGPANADGVTSRVEAVVDFFGPTNLAALYQESVTAAPAVVQYLGGTPSELPNLYADASPINHVSHASAPTLIVQGGSDTVVPPEQSAEFAQALDTAGVTHEFVTIPGATHGFGLQVKGRDLRPTVLQFLRQELAGPGPS